MEGFLGAIYANKLEKICQIPAKFGLRVLLYIINITAIYHSYQRNMLKAWDASRRQILSYDNESL